MRAERRLTSLDASQQHAGRVRPSRARVRRRQRQHCAVGRARPGDGQDALRLCICNIRQQRLRAAGRHHHLKQ